MRLHHLRPTAVAYLWLIAAALIATGTTGQHPTLGRAWDVLCVTAGLALGILPFITPARVRAALVGYSAFVMILNAEEWVRLSQASPIGFGVAALWLAVLVGLVAQVSADQEVQAAAKLEVLGLAPEQPETPAP